MTATQRTPVCLPASSGVSFAPSAVAPGHAPAAFLSPAVLTAKHRHIDFCPVRQDTGHDSRCNSGLGTLLDGPGYSAGIPGELARRPATGRRAFSNDVTADETRRFAPVFSFIPQPKERQDCLHRGVFSRARLVAWLPSLRFHHVPRGRFYTEPDPAGRALSGLSRPTHDAEAAAFTKGLDMATNRCPRCKRQFQTLDDEYGDHPCPRCGYHPSQDDEENPED